MKNFFLFSILFYISINIFSQQEWSLEQCIQYGVQNSLNIKNQALNAEIAKANHLQSKLALLPDIHAAATHSYNYGKVVDPFTNDFAMDRIQTNNFYLASSIVLFNGLKLLNNIKEQMSNTNTAELLLKKTENDVMLNIATLYLQVIFDSLNISTIHQQVILSELQVNRAELLYESGSISEDNLLNLQAQLASEQSNLITAEGRYELDLLALKQAMYYNDTVPLKIKIPTDLQPIIDKHVNIPPLDTILLYAFNNLPDIKVAEWQLQSAKYSFKAAKGNFSPTLSLSLSYGTGYSTASKQITEYEYSGYDTIGITTGTPPNFVLAPHLNYNYQTIPFKNQLNDNINQSLGLSLQIPIFNRGIYHNQYQIGKINLQIAENNLEQTKLNLQNIIEQAYYDMVAAEKKLDARNLYLKAQKIAYYNQQERFELGLISSIDFMNSKNQYTQAEIQQLQASVELLFRYIILDFYQGKSLSL
ncbi:MAG: TolC family protein [Bacteroidales bacterium]|jgi:outer membrane protein|nr:TolC family protein [Bacteroidota bacterium]HHW58733.1 TolC family protein [Bacteroidales bacterium]HOB77268.1 TolC family protein [Bacteroidales bacterium]HPZ60538.1 TolC family protein [Bacteroidales bacterium]HQD58383.1 TolC family protein [Bacteroidales bacterium]